VESDRRSSTDSYLAVVHFTFIGGEDMRHARLIDMRTLSEKGWLLDAIRNYDSWFLEERLRKDGLIADSEVLTSIDRFKDFIFLNAIGYSKLNMPVKAIDIVWHTFLLFTAEYAEFCNRFVGRFVHHIPVTSRSNGDSMDQQNLIEIYEKVFGENLATTDMADNTSECNCDSCRARIAEMQAVSQTACRPRKK
jgi:hypothetical protein